MVLSYLTSRAFACAAHLPRQLFSAARLQSSRDPLHREGLRPAESLVLGPHASLSHAQQVMPSRPSVNTRLHRPQALAGHREMPIAKVVKTLCRTAPNWPHLNTRLSAMRFRPPYPPFSAFLHGGLAARKGSVNGIVIFNFPSLCLRGTTTTSGILGCP